MCHEVSFYNQLIVSEGAEKKEENVPFKIGIMETKITYAKKKK